VCEGVASPDRLNHPTGFVTPEEAGKRGAGKWQRISWEEALGEIAGNLNSIKEKHGAREVAFVVGMPKGLDHLVLIRLANIFGSPNVVGIQDLCHAPAKSRAITPAVLPVWISTMKASS